MTGRSRAGPRRGASISRPAAVIFHARVEPGRDEHEAVALKQHERRGDEVRPAAPRSGAHVGDAAGADGVAVALVLGVAQSGEDDALLGGHDRPKLDPGADARNRGVDDPLVRSPARRAWSPDRPARIRPGEGGDARCRGARRPRSRVDHEDLDDAAEPEGA